MHNCIFSGHCTQTVCDKSCPTLVETTYLLERNNIKMSSNVFCREQEEIDKCLKIIESAENTNLITVVVDIGKGSTVSTAELITYCGICQKWKGSRLHCTVYNLKYAQYIEELRKTWTSNVEPEDLEYMKIWSNSAKLLIISNLDYVHFREFECQTLLTLIQNRSSNDLPTIIVTPTIDSLVGKGGFFDNLKMVLSKSSVKEDRYR